MKTPFPMRVTVDATGPIAMFTTHLPRAAIRAVNKAAGRAAGRIQDIAREDLQRMVYDIPESPNYKRTGTLMRATYAARPGANHAGDHAAAFSGVDLKSNPEAGGVVKMDGFVGTVDIGSWADWAGFVHDGTVYMPPRPFLARAAAEGSSILQSEINAALAQEQARFL